MTQSMDFQATLLCPTAFSAEEEELSWGTSIEAFREEPSLRPLDREPEEAGVSYLKKVATQSSLVVSSEEIELAKRIEQGDIYAKRKLVQANLRLVISIAKRYAGRGANFMDLVQEGNVGLLKAVDRFNYRLGYRFSTYATWWIKQSILQAFYEHDRPIRLPGHVIDALSKVKKARRDLEKLLDRQPTDTELAQKTQLSLKKVQQITRIGQKTISLEMEMTLKDGNTQTLADTLQDDATPADQLLHKYRTLRLLKQALTETLQPREREILEMRYGLKGASGKKMTLEKIGQLYGVTRECVRQTEIRALGKLRNSEALQQIME